MNFFLRSTSKGGNAPLYVRVQKPKYGINWLVSTGIMVDVQAWQYAQTSVERDRAYRKTPEGEKVDKQITQIEALTADMFASGVLSKPDDLALLKKAINSIVNADGIKALEEAEAKEQEQKAKQMGRVIVYLDDFISGMEKGTIRKPNKDAYTTATVSIYRKTRNALMRYMEQSYTTNITFDTINEKWVNGWVSFCQQQNIMDKTRGQYWCVMRHLTQKAVEEHICTDPAKIYLWRGSVVRDDSKVAEIALNDAEVDALYKMPLDGIREEVRDIWMIGMLLAQRVSDYGNLEKANFIRTMNCTTIVTLTQQKTGREVFIPVLDERVMHIAEKYNYDFPKPDPRAINRYIKDICHTLAETVPTLREQIVTPLTQQQIRMEQVYSGWHDKIKNGGKLKGEDAKRYREMKEYAEEAGAADGMLFARDSKGHVLRFKWELVTSHTARRTGVTSLYQSELFSDREIMSISGHESNKNFEHYLRMGGIALAERIAKKKADAEKALQEMKEQKKIINFK